ncbi:MAG: 6-phosphogluconolactonase [Pseudomonadales bacterium]|nr:6-phosphogluconolactonase [Pseudomonadales bacterium]MCP5357351.1 6-phosphogluconolactonase [Pseudomonadales bacterium]
MTWMLHRFEDDSALVAELATAIADDLQSAIDQHGRAAMAVSGGSTPVGLFRALSVKDIAWSKVVVTLVDERWVPENHADSNAALVRRHLLQNKAAKARFVGLKNDTSDPFLAVLDVEARLNMKVLPLDVVVLGMGEDGHTASFFPAGEGLDEALNSVERVCCGVRPPSAPHDRMTLSLQTLLGARQLYLHIVGQKKLTVLEVAMAPGPVQGLPVRAVLHQSRVLLEIYYAERAASAES